MKLIIDRQALSRHWQYCKWRYLALVAAAVLGWNLIFTVTAPQIPEDRQLQLYVSATLGDEELLDDDLEALRQEKLPDQQEIGCLMLLGDSYYGTMQLTAYLTNRQGDLYLLKADDFQRYAETGVFLPLEDQTELMAACEGLDLSAGYAEADGATHLYGIPADTLTGLGRYGIEPGGMVLCVTAGGGNTDNAVRLACLLLEAWGG